MNDDGMMQCFDGRVNTFNVHQTSITFLRRCGRDWGFLTTKGCHRGNGSLGSVCMRGDKLDL